MRRTCLIAGCGYTGSRLARRLQPEWHVAALARSAIAATRLATAGIEPIPCDLDVERSGAIDDERENGASAEPRGDIHPRTLHATTDGAAIAYLVPPPDTGESDPRLTRFLDALGPARPAVLLYMSTTGVYGNVRGEVVDESSPLAPTSAQARRRVAAERLATSWCEAQGVRSVVLRVPGIYGPGRLPLERLQRGEPALRPEDSGPGNRIHVDDLVTACVAALERPVHGVFNVSDGNPATTTEYLQRTAAVAGLPPPPLVALADAPGRISPGMLAYLVETRRVDSRRMREELGVTVRYARLDDGIAASLAGMSSAAG